jgi:hypothetical protein
MFSTDKDFEDFTGQRFGKYLVLDFAETRISRSGLKIYYWLVSCRCKRRKVVSTNKLRAAKYQVCECDKVLQKSKHNATVL